MQDNSGYKNNETTRALVDAIRRAQASDYSRKLAYREARNWPKLTIADVVVMFFVGILVTLMFAFLVD